MSDLSIHQHLASNPDYDPAAPDNLLEAAGEFTTAHWAQIGAHMNASWRYCSDPAREQMELAAIGRLIRNFSETYQDERIEAAVSTALAKNNEV